MKTLFSFVVLLFALPTAAFASDPAAASPSASTIFLEVVREIRLVESFKKGLSSELGTGDKAMDTRIGKALAIKDEDLELAFADIFVKRFDSDEATEILAFHKSSAGRALIASQSKDVFNPTPKLDITEAQRAEIARFIFSPTGAKLGQTLKDQSFWSEFYSFVEQAIAK